MTAPIRRKRNTAAAKGMPRIFAKWFAGEWVSKSSRNAPLYAGIPPWCALVPEWWRLWKTEHPDANPPPGWEWLADPSSPKQYRPAWQNEQARIRARWTPPSP